ncbi:MAG: hypothetical protein H5T84_07900, partial [Thermoleophilia bacterium]|nr:hypothetical protein [Thermoleophilia bacterium]
NFTRWQYVQDHFLHGLTLTPALGVAVFVGLAVCVFAAMLRAPFFRAVAGLGYPVAPRNWEEIGRLSLFYLFNYLVLWLLPLAVPAGNPFELFVAMAAQVVGILVIFADYVIVFEGLAFLPALRRSVHLVGRRWVAVVLLYVAIQLVFLAVARLYGLYFGGTEKIFVLLPVSQILVESLITLFVDLVLIFLYEQIRREVPH